MAQAISETDFRDLMAKGKLEPGKTYRVSRYPDRSGRDEEAVYLKATHEDTAVPVMESDIPADDPGVKYVQTPHREGHWYTR